MVCLTSLPLLNLQYTQAKQLIVFNSDTIKDKWLSYINRVYKEDI